MPAGSNNAGDHEKILFSILVILNSMFTVTRKDESDIFTWFNDGTETVSIQCGEVSKHTAYWSTGSGGSGCQCYYSLLKT